MADDLSTEYEDIVLGTGLQESILAAALARIGRRVLHFDRNKYYSGEWASFHLQGILDWVDSHKEQQEPTPGGDAVPGVSHEDLEEGLKLLAVPAELSTVFNLKTTCYIRDAPEEEAIPEVAHPPEIVITEQNQGTQGTAGQSGSEQIPPDGDTDSLSSREASAAAGLDEDSTRQGSEEESSPEQQSHSTESDTPGIPSNSVCGSDGPSSPLDPSPSQTNAATGGSVQTIPKLSDDGASGSNDLDDPQSGNVQSISSGSEDQPGTNTTSNVPPSNEPTGSPAAEGARTLGGEEQREVMEQGEVENDPENGGGEDSGQASQEGVVEGQDDGHGSDDAAEAVRRREWTWKEIRDQWRRFNIDLAPKLMFCRGSMVSILVQSRISRYTEFKAVSRLLTLIDDKLEHVDRLSPKQQVIPLPHHHLCPAERQCQAAVGSSRDPQPRTVEVPCSRSDVFSSRYVSMLEKRMLMKLIEFVLHYQERADDYEEFKDRSFSEFLQKRKLTPTLQHFVIHSIAMVTADTPTEESLEAMQFFLKSLGRYGNTAFLWTLYGSGELPQCFCRMSAVFGGIYMLRTTAKSLIVNSEQNKCEGIIDSEGRRLTCSNVIMDHSYTVSTGQEQACTRFVSRAVLFTDKTLKESEGDEITFLTIPPDNPGEQPIRLLEVGSSACASPKGMFVVHLTRTCRHTDPEADLMPAIKRLFQDLDADLDCTNEKPKVLWTMFFSYQDKTDLTVEELRSGQPSGVYVTGGPGASVGFQHAVKQAQEIFELICPGEEFLPPAPNPEDIIYEDPSGDNPGHSKAGFEDSPEEVQSTAASDQEVSSTADDTPSDNIQQNLLEDHHKPEEEAQSKTETAALQPTTTTDIQ